MSSSAGWRCSTRGTRGHAEHHVIPLGDGLVLDLAAHELRRDGSTGPPATEGIRPARDARGAPWPRLYAAPAARPGLGAEHDGDPRTVDVHVRWLRAKIEPEPARPVHLVTLRGIGYRLDPPDPR